MNFDKTNLNDLTWKDIFTKYDDQFDIILDTLLSIGDKVIYDTFENSTQTTLNLSSDYQLGKGHLMVYINNVIQWVDEDYEELTETSIRLLNPIELDDVVKVTIIKASGGLLRYFKDYMQPILDRLVDSSEEFLKIEFDDMMERIQSSGKFVAFTINDEGYLVMETGDLYSEYEFFMDDDGNLLINY